jgi:PDZ domain-containing protein
MLDTTTPTVPGGASGLPGDGGDGAAASRPGRPSARKWWLLGGLAGFAIVVGLAVNLIELDRVTIGPGGARPVEGLVSVGDGGEAFPAEGDILFTTVSLDDRVTVWDGLMAWLDDDVALFDKTEILGDRDEDESRQFNEELMEDSKTTAVRVALERLGYDVTSGTGAEVAAVDPEQPAADVLAGGETVVAVDGDSVELGDDLVAAVREREPGEAVTLTVEDGDGGVRDETVELGERPDLEGEAYLGIGVGTRDLEVDLPFAIDIDSGSVGGPSAGLAFTLAVLDVLTPGELTGGDEIATTGTINGLGEVGRVGGVAQKAAAVCDVGATVFLVPEAEVAEAETAACDDLEVVGVADLEAALDALAERGGNVDVLDRSVS